jgi:hypothetical protein
MTGRARCPNARNGDRYVLSRSQPWEWLSKPLGIFVIPAKAGIQRQQRCPSDANLPGTTRRAASPIFDWTQLPGPICLTWHQNFRKLRQGGVSTERRFPLQRFNY